MAKKGVLIGCNYPGTKAELRGCVNDVWRMHNCLINRYGFLEKDITVLIDTDRSYMLPTGKNIRMALSKLVRSARPGDVLFVHYSGHGTRLPAEAGEEDDDTGYDECIVPADMNLITDDDFRRLVDKIPSGCRITIVSDSCHSGGLIEAAKEQIGDSTKEGGQISGHGFRLNFLHRAMEEAAESHGIHIPSRLHCDEQENDKRRRHADQHADYSNMKSRSLPLTTLIDMLKQKTGKDDIDVGKLRHTLFDIFREDASPKVKKFMKFAFNKLRRGGGNSRGLGGVFSIMNSIADEILNQMLDEHDEGYTEPSMQLHAGTEQEAHAGSTKGRFIDCGILLSGCQTDQTSADACPSGNPEEAYGAFSNAIQAIIEETDGEITNSELVLKARRKLKWQGFSQRPGLYCSDQYVEAPFLC